ncbi:FtsX-like permease family protein [Herbidospora galbida]|uniref:FtsX-like permease family protein n=1 Tax=Herbidospora galbida TaxID=2575442 RepID=UPI0014855C02|nr:FtsX family ABC transporter permease [Herbidospora galbida]
MRDRWHAFAGGFVVLFLGMALVSMSVLALASAGQRVPDRLAGTPVFVSAPRAERGEGSFAPDRPWSPETVTSLLDKLSAIPGVAQAVPDRTFYAQPMIDGRPAPSERGYAWSTAKLAPYRLTAGTEPREGEAVVDRSLGLTPGTRVSVLTVHGPVTYTVSGTVDGPGVFLNDAEAAPLSAGVRAIGLVVKPGADVAAIAKAADAVSAQATQGNHMEGSAPVETKAAIPSTGNAAGTASAMVSRQEPDAANMNPAGSAAGSTTGKTAVLRAPGDASQKIADVSSANPAGSAAGSTTSHTAAPPASGNPAQKVADVLVGDARSVLESRDDERTRWIGMQILTGMAVLSALVSVLVVGSTFAVGVAQRRREFGLLRAVGATPRQVRAMVYGEALVVGVTATAAGVAAGALLAPVLGAVLVGVGFEPAGFTVGLSPLPLAGSFAGGVVLTLVAVWSASGRAARVGPLEALREAEVDDRPMPRLRWITGLAFCALGLASAASSDPEGSFVMSGLVAAVGVIAGLALLSPVVVPPVARYASWPFTRGRGAVGMLVRENARTAVRRTAATATPVLVTIGCAVLITGMVQTTAAGFAAVRATTIRADAVVVPDGTPGLTDASGGESSLFSALFEANGDPLSTIGATPELLKTAGETVGPLDELRHDDRILLADWLAEERGLRTGAVLTVSFEDGTSARLTVAGTVQNADADTLVSRELLRRHDPAVLADEAYVVGAAPAAGPGARVVDVETYAAEADAEEDRLVWIATLLLVVVSTAYAGVAIVNTMVVSAAGRVRDLEVLRLSGATPRQVRGTVAAESALAVLLGAGLGVVVALPALFGIRGAFAEAMNADVPLVIPWPLIGGLIAVCLVLAAGSSVLAVTTKVGR